MSSIVFRNSIIVVAYILCPEPILMHSFRSTSKVAK